MAAVATVWLLVAALVFTAPPARALTLTPISTGFNGLIGIDHHEPTKTVVVSVNYPTGIPGNFELITADGTRTPFSAIAGFTNEVKIGTVRSGPCQGGFAVGEMFTGTGVPGVIARISPDGATVLNPWITLPGETGLLRGSLFQDRYCAAGGALVAVTTGGNVWLVSSAGSAARIASLGTHLEGLTTVPSDAGRYGPWAGDILAGAEQQGCIYEVSVLPTVLPECWSLGIDPEDLDIIPANENFFGVDYGSQTLWGAPPAEFAAMVGDVLVAQESPGVLYHVHWDATANRFETESVAVVTQWEHVTFSTAGIREIPEVRDECPLSQGFWKNHAADWPEPTLVLGAQTYAQDELLGLLGSPVRGDASLILAKQLIAAKLNIANGSDPAPAAAAIQGADAALGTFAGTLPFGVRPSSDLGRNMTAMGDELDEYNNGLRTPDCGPSSPGASLPPTPSAAPSSDEGSLFALGLAALAASTLARRTRRPQ